MPPADPTDDAVSRDGLWSGAAVTPGSDLVPAFLLAFVAVGLPVAVVLTLFTALLPIPWWVGTIIGLVVAALAVWLWGERADRLVLAALGPTVPAADHPIRLTNMVEGLTLAGGVIAPSVVVIDDPARNATAIRRRDRNHLVFTTGLVDALEVVELEGAVAELLTRLRNGDAELATVGAALIGRPLIDGPFGALLASLGRAGLDRLLPADRDLRADLQAVSLTRYPPGLMRALAALEGHELAPGASTEGMAHMWLVDPTPSSGRDEQRAPLTLRIDALAEL